MNEHRPTMRDYSRVVAYMEEEPAYADAWEKYQAEKAEQEERLQRGRDLIDKQAGKQKPKGLYGIK